VVVEHVVTDKTKRYSERNQIMKKRESKSTKTKTTQNKRSGSSKVLFLLWRRAHVHVTHRVNSLTIDFEFKLDGLTCARVNVSLKNALGIAGFGEGGR